MKIIKANKLIMIIILSLVIIDLQAQTNNMKEDLNHLLGSSYYNISSSSNKVDLIVFPRFTVDISGNVFIEKYSDETISFIKNQLEKKYLIEIKIENPNYIPPYKIDDALRKERIRIMLLIGLIGSFCLFGFFIFLGVIRRRKKENK